MESRVSRFSKYIFNEATLQNSILHLQKNQRELKHKINNSDANFFYDLNIDIKQLYRCNKLGMKCRFVLCC